MRVRFYIRTEVFLPEMYRRYDSMRAISEAAGVRYWTLYNALRRQNGLGLETRNRIAGAFPRSVRDSLFEMTMTVDQHNANEPG